MGPRQQFCPNMAYPARGKVGENIIVVHSRKEASYQCKYMVRPLLQRPGRHSTECIIRWMVIVVTLIAHGCPKAAQGLLKKKPRQNQAQHRFHRAAERHLPLLPGSPGTAQSSADPQPAILEPLTYLMGCVYIFCPEHKSLRLKQWVDSHGFRWVQRSPAIAAGLTDHIWIVKELLLFLIPPHE